MLREIAELFAETKGHRSLPLFIPETFEPPLDIELWANLLEGRELIAKACDGIQEADDL